MKYKIDDTIVNTAKATECFEEDTDFDGHNQISINTDSHWEHQTLYKSSKGRWYVVETSDYSDHKDAAAWMSEVKAALWILHNGGVLPADLAAYEKEIEE
jgi:hypothetical protein